MKTVFNLCKKGSIKSLLFTLALTLNFILSACDAKETLDGLRDCIVNAHPGLSDRQLKTGSIGVSYYDVIEAYLIDEPNADGYYYSFKVDGLLPDGIDMWVSGRILIFEGLPEQTGTYNITVKVEVDASINGNGLCNNQTTKNYTLIIQ